MTDSMTKTGIILISALFISGIISGQSSFDAILKARALCEEGEPARASEILLSSIEIKPEGRLHAERGDACLLGGDYSQAIVEYNAANALVQHSGDYGLARVYALKGDFEVSLRHLELNLVSPFRKSEKEVLLDPAFSRMENTPLWRQFWKREWYPAIEKGLSEIEYYVSSGRRDEASALFSELQGIYKGSWEIDYANALINLDAGKPGEAVSILTKTAGSGSGNERLLRLLARAQTDASNHAGASATYTKLLEMEIPDAELLLLRAECYRKTGETRRAMADIERYLSLYPRDKSALRSAGKVQTMEGNHFRALEYFSENLRYHPGDPGCYIDRADSYFMLKSWGPAINDYAMSLDLDPSNPEAWLNKGIARINTGNSDDACHDFRQALKLGNRKAADYVSRYCIK